LIAGFETLVNGVEMASAVGVQPLGCAFFGTATILAWLKP
jgi:hypothetical protein